MSNEPEKKPAAKGPISASALGLLLGAGKSQGKSPGEVNLAGSFGSGGLPTLKTPPKDAVPPLANLGALKPGGLGALGKGGLGALKGGGLGGMLNFKDSIASKLKESIKA